MPVDPGVQIVLSALDAMDAPPMNKRTVDDVRDSFRLLTVGMRQPTSIIPVAQTNDVTIPGPNGDIALRIYRPEGEGPVPTIAFFHGGGFVIGDIETHDNQARRLCRDVQAVVVSVEYRRAPEDPWPAGLNDCLATTQWIGEHLDELGGDPRIAVAGDSAGGNFAAIIAQRCRDGDGPKIAAQLLIYPAIDFNPDPAQYPSRVENAEGFFLTTDDMMWFAYQYVGTTGDPTNPHLSPIAGDLTNLPPAVVVTAEYDPLRDEGEAYARALEAAGNTVVAHRFDGLIHGFFDLGVISPASAVAADRTCLALRELLSQVTH